MGCALAAATHGANFQFTPIATINPNDHAGITGYGTIDGVLVFRAFNGQSTQMYSTDGKHVRTLDIAGFDSPNPELLYVFGPNGFGLQRAEPLRGAVYFVANGVTGRTLYKTDGTTTTPILSGVTGTIDDDVYWPPIGSISEDFLYVTRNTGDDTGLYRTDGFSAIRVETSLASSASTRFFAEFRGDAILFSSDSTGGIFYREDSGSQTAISFVRITSPTYPTIFLNELFFTGLLNGEERLFRTDGTTTIALPNAIGIRSMNSLFAAGDTMYLKARDSSGYEQIYRTDGAHIERFDLGRRDQSDARFITSVGNDLYLFEYSNRRIVRANGEAIAEVSVDFRPDVGNFSLEGILGDTLVLDLQVAELGVAGSATRGLFLLTNDTATFVDINGGTGYAPSNVTIFGEDVFFTAFGANGEELFRVRDGNLTEYDINPSGSSSPAGFTIIDELLYFTAAGPTGRELYTTDGGSLQLIDVNRNVNSTPIFVGAVRGALLVEVDDGTGMKLVSVRSAVPEPTAAFLLLVGLAGILARHRRVRIADSTP